MPAREFLIVRQESALGTAVGSPVFGTNQVAIRLDGDNAFSMTMDPIDVRIPWGGGVAVPGTTLSGQVQCRGQLRTRLYASQAFLLLPWAMNKINAGQTAPWTTTELPDDLASCSVYHAYQYGNSVTVKRRRYTGVKVTGFTLAGSAQDQTWMLTMDLEGVRAVGNAFDSSSDPNATEFPEPANTNYPQDAYLWRHLTFSLGGSSRTECNSLTLTTRNGVDVQRFTDRFPQLIRVFGRDVTVDASILLKASPDDLGSFEALTALASSIVLNDATRTTTIQLNAQNRMLTLQRQLPIGGTYMYNLNLGGQFDASAGNDMSVTVV